jgi:N-acetylneuraminic acid mutarotase
VASAPTGNTCYFGNNIGRFSDFTMRIFLNCAFLLGLAAQCAPAAEYAVEPLPQPISNNAVAILKLHGEFELFSLMGIGPKKTWESVSTVAYEVNAGTGRAATIHAVPGTTGRLGAMAIGASNRVYLFGGYVIYQGGGMVVSDANVYEPDHDRWLRLPDIPVPVADAVIGVFHDRYIYLIGGRTDHGLISDVQVYDLEKSRWAKATSIPGAAVFGHAGGIVDDTIISIDGARRNETNNPPFVASEECWKGKIDHHNPANISWEKLPNHPGNAHFHIAGGASERDGKVYFSGGSETPHTYTGIGFDGKPAEPSTATFAFNVRTGKWETIDDTNPNPTMDHRGLLVTPEGLVVIGGMDKDQQVAARIEVLAKK